MPFIYVEDNIMRALLRKAVHSYTARFLICFPLPSR